MAGTDEFDDPEILSGDEWDEDAVDETGDLDALGTTFDEPGDEDDAPPVHTEDRPEGW
jgi:hypothetical protein